IRYQQKLSRAKLTISGKSGKLEFSSPVRAVTKGQIAVFYKGEVCLGGGIIK
ncbi:tRNA 2-thiouridine(34) synthase MnmA, partial [Candidatus Peregrinibacteria bacterium]|nr:tRNA 2-thiouridine(34) synthase MnmA [Candidatus Peregrinibacteria bacterium]